MEKIISKLLSSVGILLILLFSCNEIPTKDQNNFDKRKLPFNFPPDSLINTMLDSIEGGVDAIQLFTKYQLGGIAPTGSISVEASSAKAIYFFADTAGPISSVECNSIPLTSTSLPIQYYYSWPDNEGPACYSNLNWKTIINSETIYDTLPIPNGFSGMSFTTDSLDIENGGTLSWNSTSSGDVAVVIAWTERYEDGEMGWTHTSYYGTIPDNGSFSITPQVLIEAGVPGSPSDVATIGIGLHKWNLKTKSYDSGNKQLVNVAIVINSAFFWVKQE